jgi:hypothetical protein
VARGLSAVLVLAAVLLLGVLALRLTRSAPVAVTVVVLAGLTPWLFELGRVALEASTQPLLLTPLLLWLLRTTRRGRWAAAEGVPAGLLLGLLAYSYTGSRLLGPLLAAALALFDAGVRPLLEQAFAGDAVVYTDYDDRGAQARGLPRERVAILPDGGVPPAGATVFLRQECDFVCEEVARWEDYRVARALGSPMP